MLRINKSALIVARSAGAGLLIVGAAVGFAVFSRADVEPGNRPSDNALQRALILNERQQYDASLSILLAAVKEHPEREPLRLLLRQTVYLQVAKRVEEGNEKLAKDPHNIAVYLEMAEAYGLIDDRLKALEILLQGVTENPNSVSLWIAMGKHEFAAERYNEALSIFRKVIVLNGKNGEAHYVLAYLLLKDDTVTKGELSEALQHAQAAVATEPQNPEYLQLLAEASFRSGDSPRAIELIQEAIRLAPEDDVSQALLARFQSK